MALKYGPIQSGLKGREYPVAASQYFDRNGGAFVYLDGSGHVTGALTATGTLLGWAVVPGGVGAGTDTAEWKSSATAGADSIFVITDDNAEYFVPTDGTMTAAQVGNACDLIGVNDGTVQQADIGTSTTDVLIITGVASGVIAGAATSDVIVRINPAKYQADT